jgi:hypothetical protein
MPSYIDTSIRVQSITGHRGSDKDEKRACRAAEAVLRRHRVGAIEAYEAYLATVEADIDCDDANYPRLARIWLKAESAAEIAYVKGWHNPDAAYIEIAPYWY